MQIVVALLFLLAAAKVQPTPEMQDLQKKMKALNDKLQQIGRKFESPTMWNDQSAMNKVMTEIQNSSEQMESYEKQYKALKRAEVAKEKAAAAQAAAEAAKAKAAEAAATKAAAPAASKVAATAETKTATVADKVAVTPEKILTLLAAVADKPAAAPEKSPMEKLQDEIDSLKKKLDDYGKKFSSPSVYSDQTEIGKLVSQIEDAQIKMGQDMEELEKLKKAAKKAAAAKKEGRCKSSRSRSKTCRSCQACDPCSASKTSPCQTSCTCT